MSNLLLIVLMVAGGVAVALQPSINARLAEKVGFLQASTISFAVGTLVLLTISLITTQGSFKRTFEADWWQLSGGLFGAFFVTMTIIGVPRIGTTAVLALTIVSQLVAGLLMDHYGLFGMRGIPVDFKRLLGVALLLAGVALICRR
ncbi:transporter family-2 protein [Malonomonas rubra DSM 5091]|uniref:Transporter family-2 protein n=1 Tax=Malonomonas rubra DSM 5091 TaxID=1122189 RepID=A0A1M6HG32_MALRU|nr:DMT family transporter [Malonomonas rubra]SHJ21176.1 transporter family-2 protein [Malonomonas rubra DSM 5091]